MGREKGPEAVRAMMGQGQGVHRGHGAVLVEAAGNAAEAIEPQQGEQQDQPPVDQHPVRRERLVLPRPQLREERIPFHLNRADNRQKQKQR